MRTYPLRLVPGQDVKRELDVLVKAQEWSAGCVLTGIGSLTSVAIRFAGAETADLLHGSYEIVALGGTLSRSGSHLHILVSDGDGVTKGGHLMEGSIVNTTAEIVLGILPEWEFTRRNDEETGFKELRIERSTAEGRAMIPPRSTSPDRGAE